MNAYSSNSKTEVIPLRTYRIHFRESEIHTLDGSITLLLEQYFGKQIWSVPISDVAVVYAKDLDIDISELRRIPDIPYFFTTGPLTSPNLLLLFRRPQRVPRLRLMVALSPNVALPFGYRKSRSSEGAFVDGVLLRADDASAAVETLKSAGVERVDDANAWLHQHREVITDEVERTTVAAKRQRKARFELVTLVLLVVGWFAALYLRIAANFPWWGWLVLVGVALILLLQHFQEKD